MKNKFVSYLILGVVIFAVALRYFVVWCNYGISTCPVSNLLHSSFDIFIYPFFLFSIVALPIPLLLFWTTDYAVKIWLRFAMWWLPLSAILIAITPSTSNSWMPLYFIGKDTVTLVMAGLFTAISLVIIVWKQFNPSKK